MSSPVFNEETIRTMERGGSFHYDANGNPVATAGSGAPGQHTFNIQVTPNAVFTINGALAKTALLLAVVTVSAVLGAMFVPAALYFPLMIVTAIGGIGLSIWIAKNPKQAPIGATIYAVFEGLWVGMFSLYMAQAYGAGLIINALLATLAVTATMLVLYATRLLKVTDKLRSFIASATLGVFVLYLVAFVGSLLGFPMAFFYGNGWLSIAISVGIVLVAAFNLLIDFDLIETMSTNQVAKYYEWYAAFGLMVTLVWLYIEILRLLAKLQSRD